MRVAPLATGDRLGRYEIVQHLATGGMAEIYLARTTGIGAFQHHAVLKVIGHDRAHDETFVRMFLDEARVAAGLHHASVAQVHEVGESAGEYFYAMEYVHGETVRALLEECASRSIRIPIEVSLAIIIAAAAGLDHAHRQIGSDGRPLGIVHRDVSPSNIMVAYDGAVKVLDFGIVLAGERATETESGVVKGKYAYMAPEQCRAAALDRRADVFALGVVLYELTTQVRAFKCDSDFETMTKIVSGAVTPPTTARAGFPPALETIVLKALEVPRDRRYQTAAELGDALEAYASAERLSISQRAVERFARQVFGERPEPWRREAVGAAAVEEASPPTRTAMPDHRGGEPITRSGRSSASLTVRAVPVAPKTDSNTSLAPIIQVTFDPPARARWLRWVGGLTVLAAAGFVIRAQLATGEAAPAHAAGSPGHATGAPSPSPPPAPPAPPPPAITAAAPPPAVTAAPPTISLHVDSSPAGAVVYLARARQGVTPLDLVLARSEGQVVLEIERAGYVPQTLKVPLREDARRAVTLRRREKARARAGADETFSNPFIHP